MGRRKYRQCLPDRLNLDKRRCGSIKNIVGKEIGVRSERFANEKGGARGGGTAPPGPKRAEKTRFFRETTGRMV